MPQEPAKAFRETDVLCFHCGNKTAVTLCVDDYLKWRDGAPISKALNYLPTTQQHLLEMGVCEGCYPALCEYERTTDGQDLPTAQKSHQVASESL